MWQLLMATYVYVANYFTGLMITPQTQCYFSLFIAQVGFSSNL